MFNIDIFRALVDNYLRGLLSVSRDETALLTCSRNAAMFHRGKPRTHLNVLSLIYSPCVFVRKRINIGHFTRSRGSPLPFLSISRDKKAIQIPFLQFNNVSLGILLERDNSFIVSSVKFISSRAQNVQY
jgi:hypothetical protein